MKKIFLFTIALTSFSAASIAQYVTIPDANFKAVLLANTAINTNGDTEISNSEAANFNGILNVSAQGISDLTGIGAFTGSFTLNCGANQITNLDLSSNTGLYNNLEIGGNPLTSVIFPATNNITWLNCSNTSLTSLDLTNLTSLTHTWIMNHYLSALDLTTNVNLIGMNITPSGANATPISTIDLSPASNLEWFVCEDGGLTSLDISQNTSVYSLDISGNQNLSELNMANGNNMSFGPNQFDATNCPSLTCVQVDNVSFSNAVWTSAVDPGVSFSLDCSQAGTLATSMTIQGQGGVSSITTPGGTLQMIATILPAAAQGQTVYWGIASGNQFASINAAGVITAIADGTVIIGALTSDGSNISANATITISNQIAGLATLEQTLVSIYPNPASETITIHCEEEIVALTIIDNIGNVLHSGSDTNINVQHLTSGMYHILVTTTKGISTQKFQKI